MIKNEAQMKRVEARIDQLDQEIKEIESTRPSLEADFLGSQLREELESLRAQLEEYKSLREIPFQEAVYSLLQEPVLLENIGQLLAKVRIAAKLTQLELADRVGWHQSNLSRFESDNYASQSIAKVSELASALGVWLHVVPSLTEKPAEVSDMLKAPTVETWSIQISTESSAFDRRMLKFTSYDTPHPQSAAQSLSAIGQMSEVPSMDLETDVT